MVEFAFRYAEAGDARRLVQLIEDAYRGGSGGERWDSEAHLLRGPRTSMSEIEALLADPGNRFVVAESDGRIQACGLVQRHGMTECLSTRNRLPAAYFGMFAVDADMREVGLGKALLAECERRARQLWNSPAMVMTVISIRRQLIAWYERRGYYRTGVRLPFPFTATSGETTRDFDLLEMRKDFR